MTLQVVSDNGPRQLTVDEDGRLSERLAGLRDLTRIGLAALKMPPRYLRSILGPAGDWLLPEHDSEYTAADPWHPIQTLRYARDLTIPALPLQAPSWLPAPLRQFNWRPTRILFQPDHNQNPTTFPNESWFFINGICTNETAARINAGYIAKLFHRPLTIVQNATDSVGVDLAECVIGKAWSQSTEPARKAYPVILAALQDPAKERVVVLCHSQGTIIMANVLRALQDASFKRALFAEAEQLAAEAPNNHEEPEPLLDPALLNKLEIYAFANCATDMQRREGQSAPYIESYGNQYDIVARLGCLADDREALGITIDGPTFQAAGKWGHLLNQHYLFGMHDHLVNGAANPYVAAGQTPRLYGYFNGGLPQD